MKKNDKIIMGTFDELKEHFDYIRAHCDEKSDLQICTEGGEFVCHVNREGFDTMAKKCQVRKCRRQ